MSRGEIWLAISPTRQTASELKALRSLQREAKKAGDLDTWRRAKAVSGYLAKKSVISMAAELDVTRGSVNRWLQWYNARGADGLRTKKSPGTAPRLNFEQRAALAKLIDLGPVACGFSSGMWTGAIVADLIRKRYGVTFHSRSTPRLLAQMGFSLQRPRKRLARADKERQARWERVQFPALKKRHSLAAEEFSSKTKPVSGSTERSIKHGPASAFSRE
jgi:transposase